MDMMTFAYSLIIPVSLLFAQAEPTAVDVPQPDESRWRIELPSVVLSDVPVDTVRITARSLDGTFDASYNGHPFITGIRLSIVEQRSDGSYQMRQDAELPSFVEGVLELKTDLAKGRKVYITESEIVVDPESRGRYSITVRHTLRWLSLLPPLIAIGLAVWSRDVIVSLFVAVWSGAVVLAHGNFFEGFLHTLDTHLVGELVKVDASGKPDYEHVMILLFTLFLGATVGVMSRSSGTRALVKRLARFTRTREHAQLTTWGLGLFVFFDDYANTMLVGTTMRPVTDRHRISREKLAFLVDSTAAPVAGLAIVSTWVGVEIAYIRDVYQDLYQGAAVEWDAYSTFLATIPYRFYPFHLLVFVWMIAYSGRDFGPMLRAEARALTKGELKRTDTNLPDSDTSILEPRDETALRLRNALVPLAVLLGSIVVGLWWNGHAELLQQNLERRQQDLAELPVTVWSVLSASQSTRVLFISSFVASMAAVSIAVVSRTLSVREAVEAWAAGAKSMFFAAIILVLAWSVATICNREHLNTAGFLVEIAHGRIEPQWMPALSFLLAAVVSFATGSSWSTMGLLMPLCISFTYYVLVGTGETRPHPNNELMLGTIGAVLAGSIFGDHCSPISDTTVLSSAASGADHLDHVTTQIPYAVLVATISLLLGYIPVGYQISPLLLIPLGLLTMFAIVQLIGRPAKEYASEGPGVMGETGAATGANDDASGEVEMPDTSFTDSLPEEE
jgi:Na+/H+ antiporter NhaC